MDILGQKHVNSFICLLWLKILATLLFLKDLHCDNHVYRPLQTINGYILPIPDAEQAKDQDYI